MAKTLPMALLCLTALVNAALAQDFPEADIPYGTATADGVVESAWDSIPANILGVDIDGTEPTAPDFSGYWKAMWDSDNLYLLLVTYDDTTVAYPGSRFWNYDMTEVFIDPDNSKGDSYDGVNDSQLVFPRGGEEAFANANPLELTFPIAASGLIASDAKAVVEISLPWSELAVDPTIGTQMGLDVYMKDNDTGEGSRSNQISWSPSGDQAWNNASLFGTVTLVGPQATIHYGMAVADGSIERIWNAVPANPLGVDIDGTDPEDSDFSGYWKALWDSENLYLLMVTTDDTTVAYPGSRFWNYDMTELFIDPNNSKGGEYDGVDDSQFVFPRGGEEAFANANPAEITFPPAQTALVADGTMVIIETVIPFAELGLTPEEGTTFGMDVYMKDNDTGEGSRSNQLSWSPSMDQAWRNASLFGRAILSESPFPVASIPMGTMTVDGTVESEWDAIEPNILGVDIDGTMPEAADFAGYWKAAWDDANLYLLLVTMDDTTVAYPGSRFWNYDMTELFIDPDYSRTTPYDGANDSQFVFPRGGEAPFANANPLDVTFPPTQTSLASSEGMVVIETAIPWPELGISASGGTVFGLDVYMKDNDTGEASRNNQLSWSPSQDQAWRDTTLFGTVILEGDGAVPAFAEVVSAVPFGSGWVSPWFGAFELAEDDWIDHAELSWLYIGFASDASGMWVYSFRLEEWLWTSDNSGGYYYDFGNSRWIYFLILEDGTGYLFDVSLGTWVDIP